MVSPPERPLVHENAERCVDRVIETLGKTIRLGLPLGLGKANSFVNALYRRALEDPEIQLQIFTALTLDRPSPSSELERRFLEPLQERFFADYPALAYSTALAEGTLPSNIEVYEFYFQPGGRLTQARAQRNRLDSNYSHVMRDVIARGINVISHLVATRTGDDEAHYSVSCNSDIFVDLAPHIEAWRAQGVPVVTVAEVNENLPFMPNDAEVARDFFDHVILPSKPHFKLFAIPNRSVSIADHATGLHASRLVRDGGTLQLGIGSFSDATTHGLLLRHRENEVYRQALTALGVKEAEKYDPFERGLYGCSEMLVEGFIHLMQAGVMKRRVYHHPALQVLADTKGLPEHVTPSLLDELRETGHLGALLSEADVEALRADGVLCASLRYVEGKLVTSKGEAIRADLCDASARTAIEARCLGGRLNDGFVIHGGFFVGSPTFYQSLRNLSENERDAINMTGVQFINRLHDGERLKALQRRDATFINNAMMVTLHGAVVSDTLENYRVVSGVGGQFNFVSMAHALSKEGGRAVIVVRSTRKKKGRRRSNIVWDYPNVTVPGHLRDLVVTEYGIADLRGKSDSEVMKALINIADRDFQDELLKKAKASGKVEQNYRIPERHRCNTPRHLQEALEPLRAAGKLSRFPLGTELSEEEQELALALKTLQEQSTHWGGRVQLLKDALLLGGARERHERYLERMRLDRTSGLTEMLLRRLVVSALSKSWN